MTANRVALMVLDRCACEIPSLAGAWYANGRYATVDLWAGYLATRAPNLGGAEREALARTVVEIITLWAVKIPWDPAPRIYPTDTSAHCATMVRHLIEGATE